MNTFRILSGHWLTVAPQIPDASAHLCVTSVPYYGLRSYGTPPQIWDAVAGCQHEHWIPIKQYKDSWRRGERAAAHHSDAVRKLPDVRKESCPDCDECARLAYSDATTAGFFSPYCAIHRNAVGANQIRSREELRDGRWTCTEVCEDCGAWRGELGQEPSPALYITHLVACFTEVWRILRPDAPLLVNIGDAHYNYRPGKHDDARAQGHNRLVGGSARDVPSFTPKRGMKIDGLKEKDLIGLPWMLAFAMRDAGWYWRSEIIWNKPNPLRESVVDRFTKSHEPILLFTKQEKYYWDKWAITEPPSGNAHPRYAARPDSNVSRAKGTHPQSGDNDSFRAATAGNLCPGGRNKGTVWTIKTQGYTGENHFAAFPEELPIVAIKAGTSEVGCCRDCLAPWRRIVLKPLDPLHARETLEDRWRRAAEERGIDIDTAVTGESITLGWQRACKCSYVAGPPVPCTTLEPFGGRGTTPTVSVRLHRNSVVAEIKPEYVELITQNVNKEAPLWVTQVSENTSAQSEDIGSALPPAKSVTRRKSRSKTQP